MTTREALIAARAMIDTPEKWIKDAYARNAEDNDVSAFDPSAVCWDASGALIAVGADLNSVARILEAEIPAGLTNFTDDLHRTHAEVMELFDRAIELAGGAQ